MNKPGRFAGAVDSLNGLILTGGRSTRMGQDKSLLTYHSKPQREHLTDLLRPFCDTVFWSVNAQQAADLANTGQLLIVDAFDLAGPMNGILSAFQHDPETAWLVVACDMPLLTSRSLDALVAGRNPEKPATAFYDSDGRFPEPLLTIWEPSFGPILLEALTAGNQSPRQLLMLHDCQLLTIPDARELLSINSSAERKTLEQQS